MTLNPRFGTSDDLMTLSKAVHDRGMSVYPASTILQLTSAHRYLMIDVVINNIPALSVNTSLSSTALQADLSAWTDPNYFHPHCPIDYSNQTSVENWFVLSFIPSVCTAC